MLARPSDMMPRAVNEKGSDGTVEVTLLHFSDWHVRVEPVKGTAQNGPGLCSQYDIDKGGQLNIVSSSSSSTALVSLSEQMTSRCETSWLLLKAFW